jgi:alpha-D-ribose 1-methylphosphonate 5-triphosphate synthase subunit PhnH
MMSVAPTIQPGFARPVHDSQAVFRTLLAALSRPGRPLPLPVSPEPVAPLGPAMAALALTLLDLDTPLWLDAEPGGEAAAWLRFHCGCPLVSEPGCAAFALITRPADQPALDAFHLGEAAYPDRATTLVIQVPELARGDGALWQGPGVKDRELLRVTGLAPSFWAERAALQPLFPLGLDIFFVTDRLLAGCPRTTRVKEA